MKYFKYIMLFITGIIISCHTGATKKIYHKETELFIKNWNFSSQPLNQFMIDGVVISPFFRHWGNNEYSIHCSAYCKEKFDASFLIHSANVFYFDGKKEIDFSENINKLLKFKEHSDNSSLFWCGYTIFEKKMIVLPKSNSLVLKIDVSIIKNDVPKRKIIEYNFKYIENKYIVELSQ